MSFLHIMSEYFIYFFDKKVKANRYFHRTKLSIGQSLRHPRMSKAEILTAFFPWLFLFYRPSWFMLSYDGSDIH